MALSTKQRQDFNSIWRLIVNFFGFRSEALPDDMATELIDDSIVRVADGAIAAGTLYKPSASTAGRMVQVGTGDTNLVVVGVAITAASGAGVPFIGVEKPGVQVKVKSDGTTVIAPQDVLEVSPNVAGRVRKGTTNPIYIALSNAAATLDLDVDGI